MKSGNASNVTWTESLHFPAVVIGGTLNPLIKAAVSFSNEAGNGNIF